MKSALCKRLGIQFPLVALGVPPASMLELGRKHGVAVAALVGAKEHAVRQRRASSRC